ncbi:MULTISPECIES: hypothetical protein [unclassified Streptomyces]|uniref:hypothetical protein n=1 Tax=unclassified Streptomyces TaxID=2593676 RepID=UPI002251CE41|nr:MULTISPECIES: hypothetical protein [unclassified Streptomyces]WSU26774.1 hypothetical protein OG508_39260 [Streptomyces sp. NBC_01108]MCX4792403.1 hypothetical protein [Streptomyces sp. NBC_01221]MCX4799861.1 hypothetical protein [Streptomyces sp. NBC_01242]WSJ41377.1 hypothetical protein OG772_37055 [Streptomyces sp. NBC_01321]WSP67823.1 hypothetical protein OG466_39350 [Streptomyces sp. NBC_01240]
MSTPNAKRKNRRSKRPAYLKIRVGGFHLKLQLRPGKIFVAAAVFAITILLGGRPWMF